MNQPQQRLHQRWRRGRHPGRNTASREWEGLPHTREKTQGQEPLHGKQQQQQQPPRSGDAFGSKQNVTVVPAPEDVPPDAENIEEDS